MAIEARARRSERGARGKAEPEAIAHAVGVGPERQVLGQRVDVLGTQCGIAAEATGGEQRRARADLASLTGFVLDLRPDHGAVLDQESLRRPSREEFPV